MIINSNVKHELVDGEYADRRASCQRAAQTLGLSHLRDATLAQLEQFRPQLDNTEYRRARHVITENGRTIDAADALRHSDWPSVGQLMYASHESLRDDFEVSCAELDTLVELARTACGSGAVIGSRMTGGGFGGCTVSLVQTSEVEAVTDQMTEQYIAKTGIEPTIFVTEPSAGAFVVED